MGVADAAFVLWHDFLRWDPGAPDWVGRDRFVLSAGHMSMLVYSLLHLGGGIMHFVFWDPTPGFGEWDSEEAADRVHRQEEADEEGVPSASQHGEVHQERCRH